MSLDGFLPPGVTDRTIAEEGTHDLERCARCGKLKFAAALDENRLCNFCAEPEEAESPCENKCAAPAGRMSAVASKQA